MIRFIDLKQNQTPAVSQEAKNVNRNENASSDLLFDTSVFLQELKKKALEGYFLNLKSIWEDDTMFSSSTTDIINNHAYQTIIRMGKDVIPFILEDLKKTNNHWFYALQSITGVNPVKEEHRGIVQLMAQDWLEWLNS